MVKILHNNSCSKSRSVLEFLDENGVEFELIDIVSDPLSVLEIETLLKKLDLKPIDIVRKNEPLYKSTYADKNLTDAEWIEVLSKNSNLIERPILIKGSLAMVARPIEKAKFFIEA